MQRQPKVVAETWLIRPEPEGVSHIQQALGVEASRQRAAKIRLGERRGKCRF